MDKTNDNIAQKLEQRRQEVFEQTGERECEICGAWFKPNIAFQKYCPECSKSSGKKRVQLQHAVDASVRRVGNGTPRILYTYTCKQCGKIFQSPSRFEKEFCSNKCRKVYKADHAVCANCGKLLKASGVIFNPDLCEANLFCSNECREEKRWKIARSLNQVHVCEYCGKEFIRSSGGRFCSQECYKAFIKEKPKKPEPAVESICVHCGKKFTAIAPRRFCSVDCRVASAKAIRDGSPLTDLEKKEKEFQVNRANRKRQAAENKKAAEREAYIAKNGLCSICKTSYKDCERMQTDFRVRPKGAMYQGNIIVKCPKFKG